MKVEEQLTPAEMRVQAERWFERQCAISAKALGESWPGHRDWVESYLREEIRQRLIARGWRPKK
ncbi:MULTISPECIES: hypothetical protein [unclassified Variovorax]|uniref:hypothetical protein n=1 Tax=unclassified Variovorax TaxID=663243 RepID=UPI00076D6C4F|nr:MULTISPECIES: hypothetical protein [unclassified Variovorax]KWT64457.1 hypothetical protein APY03_7635 [Variovorax sp. WDL1]PNG56329.1 hypothetical protein CHC07_02744 [Variovorax sp. B4]PNG57753.1 hypothetical protein CHC06_02747 [Variovorax sp. B2]VTV09815.1 hypothetical protein WDL1CHR_00882 [Variovorax sp. WDL1]